MTKNGRRVFILGAGASCPYGYPSGGRLRELICRGNGFMKQYNEYLGTHLSAQSGKQDILRFRDTFFKSSIKSIDFFMSKNPKLAPLGKYVIAFEILRSEKESCFAEEAKWQREHYERARSSDNHSAGEYCEGRAGFIGDDWYSYIYNRFLEQQSGESGLPDFSGGELAFITFNYDRSLEQFLHESLRNSFTEVPEEHITQSLRQLKILHAYGQMVPLRWQDAEEGIDYKPQEVDEPLLKRAAANIKTIYERAATRELEDARQLLACAEQVFFLGFGYARENMDVLGLPAVLSPHCQVYGTAFGLIEAERKRVLASLHDLRGVEQARTSIESGDVDCHMLLRKHF